MNFEGILLGLATFLCIGMFHPIVIKAEYYLGTGCWWAFALVGIGAAVTSLFIANVFLPYRGLKLFLYHVINQLF